MRSQDFSAARHVELNFTSASTLHHLVAVGFACTGLWLIIIATFGV